MAPAYSIFRSPGGFTTFTLSQETCLVVGTAYLVTYNVGINAGPAPSSTGCSVGLSVNGQIFIPEVPICGGIATAPGLDVNGNPVSGDFGTCTEASNRDDTMYQQFLLTYFPTEDETTFTITGTCSLSSTGYNSPGVIDLISVRPSP